MSSPSQPLLELIKLANEIQETILGAEGELTPEVDKLLLNLEDKLTEKIDGYKMIISRAEQEALYWKARADEAAMIRKRFEAYADRLKKTMLLAIEQNGEYLAGNDWFAKRIASKPSVIIDDSSLVPPGHKEIVQTTSIKKELILEDLKAGIPVPGAHLEQGYYLKFTPNPRGLNGSKKQLTKPKDD